MSKVPIYITIEGISGYNPLYVPVAEETHVRAGRLEPTSPKISNDSETDITVNLSTMPLIVDLSNGAWQKFADPNAHRYYEPVFTNGSTTPLAWTACPEAPLMPGCANDDQSGAFSFKQIVKFGSAYYGLDTKNNKVWKNTGALGAAWTDTTCTAAGNYSALYLNPQATRLWLGTDSGNAFNVTTGGTWADGGYAAQRFLTVGKDWWISSGRTLTQKVSTNPVSVNVGLPNTDITALLYYGNKILIGKPEGVFEFNGRSQSAAEQIFYAHSRDSLNCNFLVQHGGGVYFAADEGFYEYDGSAILDKTFAQFDGSATRAFYGGRVLNAYSDGRNMWLVFRVTTEDSYYNNFIVLWSERTGGFHPIYVTSSTSTSWDGAGIFFDNQKCRYSLGYNSATGAKTGMLLTDSVVPMAVDSTYPYTWSVGITSGWADWARDCVTKWWKGVVVSTKDLGSGSDATATVSYQKWTDTSFTSLGTATGTKDNYSILDATSPVPGFASTKINTKIMLTNAGTSSSKSKAFWLQSLHWLGTVMYETAFYATIVATLDMQNPLESGWDEKTFDGATILAGLKAGINQLFPVKLTMNDGNSYIGVLEPAGQGDLIDSVDSETGAPRDRTFAFAFRELK